MMRALWTASTGMVAQQFNLDNISNNLANVNTAGYKKTRVEFKDLLYETLERGSLKDIDGKPVNVQVGHGVQIAATSKIFTVGNVDKTFNPYDMMIDGNGFFKVKDTNGTEFYTKDGAFKLSINGDSVNLVTSDGYAVQGSNGDVNLGSNTKEIIVNESGKINVKNSDGTLTAVGDLSIITFANPSGLEAIGKNLFKPTDVSGAAVDTAGDGSGGSVLQGFLESSNVQVVEEMVKLIQAQRAYEINSKSIQTADEMLGMANNLRR